MGKFTPFLHKKGGSFRAANLRPETADGEMRAMFEPPEPEAAPEPAPTAEEIQGALEQARARGFEEGRESRQPEIDQLQEQLSALQPILEELGQIRRGLVHRAARDIADIVLLLARRVLGDSLALHPQALPKLVDAAVNRLADEDQVWIKVPPSAVDEVRAQLDTKLADRVIGDESITAGCIVETQYASIESSLDAAMDGVEQAVARWLESRQ